MTKQRRTRDTENDGNGSGGGSLYIGGFINPNKRFRDSLLPCRFQTIRDSKENSNIPFSSVNIPFQRYSLFQPYGSATGAGQRSFNDDLTVEF